MELKNALHVLALALLASPVAAQDGTEAAMKRTPASAQQFLTSEKPSGADIGAGEEGVYGQIMNVTATDICKTTYQVLPVKYAHVSTVTGKVFTDYSGPDWQNGTWKAEYRPHPTRPQYDATIDWSKVRNVAAPERKDQPNLSYIDITAPNAPESSIIFTYGLPELRDRVIAAMKFLQAACDSTAETGF